MANVWVLNTTDQSLTDGYNGDFYEFAPGKWVEVSEEIAVHVFGYQQENKEPYLIRLGWTRFSNDLPQAFERLEKIKISNQPQKTTANPSPVVGRIPPSSEKKEGGKGTDKAA
jgi:hypothetical protein